MRSNPCVLTLAALGTLCACGADTARRDGDPASGVRDDGLPLNVGASARVASVPWPADPCAWISVAEVESMMGPLAGAPRAHEGGCLYPLPLDAETARRREAADRLQAQAEELARRMGTKLERLPDERRFPEPAVIVQVSLDATAAGERGLRAAEQVNASWLPNSVSGTADSTRPTGWDYAQSPIAIGLPGFLGRVGQLLVTVTPQSVSAPDSSIAALAGAVRDRVPDRPFAPADAQAPSEAAPAGPDPCGLLPRADAEEVLGALVVPPYRGRETTPFPDADGESCVYQSAHQRTFRVTPTWSGGRSEMSMVRGLGGPVSSVLPDAAPESADTLEGPWDEAALEPSTGALVFLKGDRVLRVSHVTSSTDAAGAVRLARIALERLAAVAQP
jgi:hypothetical protein